MAKEDETPRTNPAEIESLIEQIRGTNLDPRAKDKVERLLRTVLTLVELLQRKNTSIKKLREMIFGNRTERHQARKAEGLEKVDESEKPDDGRPKAAGDQDARAELRAIESGQKTKRKGHGRRAASDYSGAKIVKCRHEGLKAGDDCPTSCGGRLYDLKEPTALMQFTGQTAISAKRSANLKPISEARVNRQSKTSPLSLIYAGVDAPRTILHIGGGCHLSR